MLGKAIMFKSITCTAALALTVSAATASHRYVEFSELVHTSHAIVDGRVDEIITWMDQDGMINTEVNFKVIDLVHADPAARAFAGNYVTLRFPGGVLEDRALSVSGIPSFTEGERVLLFTLLDGKHYVNPILGGEQGIFRILERGTGNTMFPMKSSGRGILDVTDDRIQLSPYVTGFTGGRANFQQNIMEEAPASSIAGDRALTRTTPERGQLLSLKEFKHYITTELQQSDTASDLTLQFHNKASQLNQIVDDAPDAPSTGEGARPKPTVETDFTPITFPPGSTVDRGATSLCYCGSHETFIIIDMLPDTFWAYTHDETALWYWNQFIDIYRITDGGGYAGGNDENEFGGWASSFGSNYNNYTWGATTLAVTFTWQSNPCNAEEINESDVFYNPNYSWTDDFDLAFNANFAPTLYQPIAIHEIGHTWGSQIGQCNETYDYNRLSVMHAGYDDIRENGRGIHSGDAWGVRGAYEDQETVISVVDVGCESYYSNNGTLTNSTTSPGSSNVFLPGDSITIQDITCENMSSSSTADVKIRLWLSWNETISDGDAQMGGDWTWSSLGSESEWTGDLTTTIPNIAPGMYFLGAIMTVDGSSYTSDGHGWNNSAVFVDMIEIGTPPPANDDCNDAQSVGEGTYSFSTDGATTDGGSLSSCSGAGMAHNDIWFEYTPDCDGTVTISTCNNADFDTVIAVYDSNSACPPWSSDQLGCNDDTVGCSGNTSELVIDLAADEPYKIRVGSFDSNSAGDGELSISISSYVANDTCDIAETIGEGQTSVDTDCSATEGSECGQMYFNDVWYRYVATCTGTLTVDTCDSGFNDTVLAVYHQSGAACNSAALLGCNDDTESACSNIYASQVITDVTKDEVYLIRVGHYESFDTGQFSLGLSLDGGGPNDDCIDAIAVVDGDVPFDTRCSDTDGVAHLECAHDGQTYHDIWFSYEAPVSGDLTLSTCDQADFDTDIAMYRDSGSCPPGDDALIGCNDDGDDCSGYTSYMTARIIEGEQYLIRVGGWNLTHEGTGILTIDSEYVCITDIQGGDGATNVLDLLSILSAWGTDDPNADVNGDGEVNVLDLLAVIGAWGPCPGQCDGSYTCGDIVEDYLCGDNCLCLGLADGSDACMNISESNCLDYIPCEDGDCPPGYGCAVSVCCSEPICMPYCE
jgi:hypothetical protein